MDLNKIIKNWDEEENKEENSKSIYTLLIDEDYLEKLISLVLESNEHCINFLFYDIDNSLNYNTVLYKIIKYSINKTDYYDYIKFLKKISKIDFIFIYIENTDLWNISIDTDTNYLESDDFLKTIFGCLWKKTLNNEQIYNDLYDIFYKGLNTQENWKQIIKWLWNVLKNKYYKTFFINYDNNNDFFLFDISSIIYKIFTEYCDKFHIKNLSDKVIYKINNIIEDYSEFDIINYFNSKIESIFLTCIFSIHIVFIPMKHNYINMLNQEAIIENQIINITNDYSLIYETTKINLLNKCNSELNKNRLNMTELMQNINKNKFLNNSFIISEYLSYFILEKMKIVDGKNIFNTTFIEITSNIINFNISYNDNIKINEYPWEDFIILSIMILKKPKLTNNNPHIRFTYLEILCYASFDMFIGKNNINENIKNKISNLHINMIPTKRNNLKTIMKNSSLLENLIKDSFNLYIDVDNLGEDLQFSLKPKVKYDLISLILNLINNNSQYCANLKDITIKNNFLIIKVINIILNDTCNHLDDIFTIAETIYVNYSKNQISIMSYFENVNNLMKTVLHNIDIILSIQEISLEPFIDDIIFQKLVETLNYYFHWSSGNNPDMKKSENFSNIFYIAEGFSTFNIKLFKICLLHIYISLSQHKSFYKLMVQDKRSFNMNYLENEIHNYIETYSDKNIKISPKNISKLYTPHPKNKCFEMISKLKDEILKLNENQSSNEPPEIFVDPISCIIMNDPVTLPSSNIILDRTIIIKHLLTTSNDPFTREKLTIDDLNEFNNTKEISEKMTQLKEKIINWKKNESC